MKNKKDYQIRLKSFIEKLSYILNPAKPRKNKIADCFMFGYDDR